MSRFIIAGELSGNVVFFAGFENYTLVKIYGNSKLSPEYCEPSIMNLKIFESQDKNKDIKVNLEIIKKLCTGIQFEDWKDKLEILFKDNLN